MKRFLFIPPLFEKQAAHSGKSLLRKTICQTGTRIFKRSGFIFIFAFLASVPSIADNVPFAQPPLPVPGQSPLPSLADIMQTIQARHIKLWYAIQSKNWGLLDYELQQIKDSFNRAVIHYRNIPIELIISANEPIIEIDNAVKSKNGTKLEKNFVDLTATCNNCHQAAGVDFIQIQKPTSLPFSNQNFAAPK